MASQYAHVQLVAVWQFSKFFRAVRRDCGFSQYIAVLYFSSVFTIHKVWDFGLELYGDLATHCICHVRKTLVCRLCD